MVFNSGAVPKESNIDIIQIFQNNVQRTVVNAPWSIRSGVVCGKETRERRGNLAHGQHKHNAFVRDTRMLS